MANHTDLTDIYRRASVMEIVQRIGNCDLGWTQIDPTNYRSTISESGSGWDLYLSWNPKNDIVTLDFRKDGNFFYSINSEADSTIKEIYSLIIGDVNAERDQEIFDELTGI